eukprot:GHVT01064021.1.p1 GENE.GHVT01064021.1~~GHVT01064021.1.p1  ORF type:complete len:471 (+),score=82.15 GHVT01064021.1:230-1642(+)
MCLIALVAAPGGCGREPLGAERSVTCAGGQSKTASAPETAGRRVGCLVLVGVPIATPPSTVLPQPKPADVHLYAGRNEAAPACEDYGLEVCFVPLIGPQEDGGRASAQCLLTKRGARKELAAAAGKTSHGAHKEQDVPLMGNTLGSSSTACMVAEAGFLFLATKEIPGTLLVYSQRQLAAYFNAKRVPLVQPDGDKRTADVSSVLQSMSQSSEDTGNSPDGVPAVADVNQVPGRTPTKSAVCPVLRVSLDPSAVVTHINVTAPYDDSARHATMGNSFRVYRGEALQERNSFVAADTPLEATPSHTDIPPTLHVTCATAGGSLYFIVLANAAERSCAATEVGSHGTPPGYRAANGVQAASTEGDLATYEAATAVITAPQDVVSIDQWSLLHPFSGGFGTLATLALPTQWDHSGSNLRTARGEAAAVTTGQLFCTTTAMTRLMTLYQRSSETKYTPGQQAGTAATLKKWAIP